MTKSIPSVPALPRWVRRPQRHDLRGPAPFPRQGCGRFVESSREGPVSEERKALVLCLLGERRTLYATALYRSWL